MSEFGIPDPLILEGDISQNYKTFVSNFNNYSDTMGLKEMPEKNKIMLFLTTIGKDARELYKSFDLPTPVTLENIMDKFELFCTSYKDNSLYHSYKFHKRMQLKDETFNEFLKNICALARQCCFEFDKERIIRDKIIMGIRDSVVRKEIFINGYQKLDEIIEFCRKKERGMETGTGVVNQLAPTIKTEKVMEKPEKEVTINIVKNVNGDGVTSSQEMVSDDISELNEDDNPNLEKGEVSTSTPTKREKLSLLTDKNEDAAINNNNNNNNKKKLQQEEKRKSRDENGRDDSSYEIIVIESSDDEDAEPEPEKKNRHNNTSEVEKLQNFKEQAAKPVRSGRSLVASVEKVEKTPKYFKCGKCDETFEEKPELESHMSICFRESLTNKKSAASSILFPGKGSENSPEKQIQNAKRKALSDQASSEIECTKCQKVFEFPCRLKRHLKWGRCTKIRTKKTAMYKCEKCNMKFKQKINFKRHLILHKKKHGGQSSQKVKSAIKMHLCHICNRPFSQTSNLTRHIKTVHRKVDFNPTNKIPNLKIILEENGKGNLGMDREVFKCDECPREYHYKGNLKVHKKRAHRNDYPGIRTSVKRNEKRYYTCVICFKKFAEKNSYKAHELIHQNDGLENLLSSENMINELTND